MSFRKEKKYRLTYSDQMLLKETLFAQGMIELHPPREVISCYFDNASLDMYRHSDEGLLPRKKIRVRHYGNSGGLRKETKISSVEGRFKDVEPLSDFISNKFEQCTFFDPDYGVVAAVLQVRYEREYFSFQQMRITFDKNITYGDPDNCFSIMDDETVMEIKVSPELSDDYLEQFIPYPIARFSKYSRGMYALGYRD